MIHKEIPYDLRTVTVEGITRYYISFLDEESIRRETEVSRPVYSEFSRFVKIEESLSKWDERYRYDAELSDEVLRHAFIQPKSLEETVFDSLQNEHLRRVIQTLPDIQRRRFVLYHEFGLTYEQIAKLEGCAARAIKYSVDIAIERIQGYFADLEGKKQHSKVALTRG